MAGLDARPPAHRTSWGSWLCGQGRFITDTIENVDPIVTHWMDLAEANDVEMVLLPFSELPIGARFLWNPASARHLSPGVYQKIDSLLCTPEEGGTGSISITPRGSASLVVGLGPFLKPCPFCGSAAKRAPGSGWPGETIVVCSNDQHCRASMAGIFGDKNEIELWNARH